MFAPWSPPFSVLALTCASTKFNYFFLHFALEQASFYMWQFETLKFVLPKTNPNKSLFAASPGQRRRPIWVWTPHRVAHDTISALCRMLRKQTPTLVATLFTYSLPAWTNRGLRNLSYARAPFYAGMTWQAFLIFVRAAKWLPHDNNSLRKSFLLIYAYHVAFTVPGSERLSTLAPR